MSSYQPSRLSVGETHNSRAGRQNSVFTRKVILCTDPITGTKWSIPQIEFEIPPPRMQAKSIFPYKCVISTTGSQVVIAVERGIHPDLEFVATVATDGRVKFLSAV